ncbi:hypothetical protein BDZ94DRAFT_1209274 [Collybia nuda]|uniref:Zinc finger Mcm10/DnaG-type domain-containing protein n=1 Tax=Collybia nuda TaxID=64659 RepID=A0A9P5YFG4_9AGAR|nr:hypothetical protein BDZ94DRAFT_1209274 [Collybia nuda]
MESSTSRTEEERLKQLALRQKIALLQAQLKDIPDDTPPITPTSPKRKVPEPALLVPPTPSPKKRKPNYNYEHGKAAPMGPRTQHASRDLKTTAKKPPEMKFTKPAPSNFLNKLAALSHQPTNEHGRDAVVRSSAFADTPPPNKDVFDNLSTPRRDERLALIEDLEPGPAEYTPPVDDPDFKQLEPNSGIRLSSRSVPHEDIQDHLRGRYYLPPSRLYSAIRLLPDKQGYDVPVPGDWITIAVVAERGPIKFSRAPVAAGVEDENGGEQRENAKDKKGKGKEEPTKPSGKKYVNFKLIDFGSRSSSSATGGKAVIRGDAFLSLLLFESDRFDLVTVEGQSKPKKVYKGGSRGAYESLTKVKEGDVIVLLNPRILKPFQRSNDNPHPTNNILAVTPESAESIMVIGRSRDLGMCMVSKKDGKPCGSWCDKRVSDVCEWHIQNAVERRRAARPEFSIGTTGMSTSAAPKRKPAYDPARQWGLKPPDSDSRGGSSTYVVSGHIVGGSSMDSRSLYATENIGREGQAKAKRRLSGKDADRALKGLLERDKEGMRAVMKAREMGKATQEGEESGKAKKRKGAEKTKEGSSKKSRSKGKGLEDSNDDFPKPEVHLGKNAYSAEIIKQIGFDPIAKAGQRRGGDSEMQKKFEALQAAQTARKIIALGPRPGQKIRSGVTAPRHEVKAPPPADIDLDESDDDLPLGPLEPKKVVDIDE